jgi:hypothetical protein
VNAGKKTKEERKREAQLEATARVGKQMMTLSLALLRVDALSEALAPKVARVIARQETDEELREEAVKATARLENSDQTSADGLLSLVFATLYAVVEKWQEWKFSDPAVDKLLESPHVKLLAKHRHAVFHADYYDHKDIRRLADQKEAWDWADDVSDAIREALRGWHEEPVPRMKAHLRRLGV